MLDHKSFAFTAQVHAHAHVLDATIQAALFDLLVGDE